MTRRSPQTRLAAAIASLSTPTDVEEFLAEILTPVELRKLISRWELLELLEKGVSQRQIAARLGLSLCKITRGAKILKIDASQSARLVRAALKTEME